MRKVPYDPLKDFAHILSFGQYLFALVVKADAPWKTFEEFVAYAKANPDKLTYSTTGVGAPSHVGMVQLGMAEKIRWRAVPFKGGAAAVKAVLGGQVDFHAGTGAEILSNVKANRLRVLLSLSDRRWPAFQEIPSITEKGYDFFLFSNISVAAPKGIAEDRRRILEEALVNATKAPKVVEIMEKFNLPIVVMRGKEYAAFCAREYAKMTTALKEADLLMK
jgi:tripartite-type tricarboxylate transporter receptor subunit TctC